MNSRIIGWRSTTPAAIDLIDSGHFSAGDPNLFRPVYDVLMKTDYYMHLADLRPYLEADQRLLNLYADPRQWARTAVLNVASSGEFSSDRTVSEYAKEIWGVTACPVPSEISP